jgi:hypothetical protein
MGTIPSIMIVPRISDILRLTRTQVWIMDSVPVGFSL